MFVFDLGRKLRVQMCYLWDGMNLQIEFRNREWEEIAQRLIEVLGMTRTIQLHLSDDSPFK